MEPSAHDEAAGGAAGRSRAERMRLRYRALQRRGRALQARAVAERSRHASVDATFEMVDRDAEVGGGIIAGALAYRLFIWLLPFGLVLIGGLGVAADASSRSPKDAAGSLGVSGIVASSIASAAGGRGRWYALLIGIPILLLATRSVLRVMIGAHRLVWGDIRARAPKPTPKATLRFLGLLLSFWVLIAAVAAVRHRSSGSGLLLLLAAVAAYAGLWLLISLRLPHRDAAWTRLVPGALIVGGGIEVLHAVSVYVIAPWAVSKQGTYGALGVAAAILFGLFMISRLVVGAAIVNATLWERHVRPGRPPEAPPPAGA